MTEQQNIRRAKLEELHLQSLTSPMPAKEARQVELGYLNAVKAWDLTARSMLSAVAAQKKIALRKKQLEEKHAAQLAKMAAEKQMLSDASGEIYDEIQELAKTKQRRLAELDASAAQLVLAFGSGPVVIAGVTYDFGCHGERVYLVPRAKQSMVRKAKR